MQYLIPFCHLDTLPINIRIKFNHDTCAQNRLTILNWLKSRYILEPMNTIQWTLFIIYFAPSISIREEGTNVERVKIEDKGVFAPVGMVMVTRSRNRPYVRISYERVERRWRAHKWKIRGPLFRRASSLDDAVREILDPPRRYMFRRSLAVDRSNRPSLVLCERAPSLKSRSAEILRRGAIYIAHSWKILLSRRLRMSVNEARVKILHGRWFISESCICLFTEIS